VQCAQDVPHVCYHVSACHTRDKDDDDDDGLSFSCSSDLTNLPTELVLYANAGCFTRSMFSGGRGEDARDKPTSVEKNLIEKC